MGERSWLVFTVTLGFITAHMSAQEAEMSVLYTLQSPNEQSGSRFGHSVAALGNVTDEDRPEVLVGAVSENPGTSPNAAGRAYVFTPEMVLSAQYSMDVLDLSWTLVPETSSYWVYGTSADPYFVPGFEPDYEHRLAVLGPVVFSWESVNGIGDPAANWIYTIVAVNVQDQELCRSNRSGEHDFELDLP